MDDSAGSLSGTMSAGGYYGLHSEPQERAAARGVELLRQAADEAPTSDQASAAAMSRPMHLPLLARS